MKVIPIVDLGTAYGRPAPTAMTDLTQVGAGTPMGELLRRYWHPIGLSADATSTPRQIRVLGEDLILFRTTEGEVGLVYPHCAHRGASLYYGKVDDKGIRCCYHGWLFSPQGNCLEQPCETKSELSDRAREKIRQPWYPVQEHYGLVWAYMGSADKKPVLPRYACLEELEADDILETNDKSIGGGGPQIIDCNWLQHYENLVDPFHVNILHSAFSGTQFVPEMAVMPIVEWETTEISVRTKSVRHLPDGRVLRRISEAGLPTLRVIPNPRVAKSGVVESLGWVLPIDDDHFRIYVVGRVKEVGELAKMRSRLNDKLWEELTEAEHQLYPGDYEAMVSQGKVAKHSEEHLATSDIGIVKLRKLLRDQLKIVAEGGNPAGVSFDPSAPLVRFSAGNFFE